MSQQIQVNESIVRSLPDVIHEIQRAVEQDRTSGDSTTLAIRDLRWEFDQVSAKMNQAIYNEQHNKIHEACLKTVSVLIEILSRS